MWFYCCQLSANETCSCSLQGEINDGKSNNFRVNFMHLCEKLDALSSFLLNRAGLVGRLLRRAVVDMSLIIQNMWSV